MPHTDTVPHRTGAPRGGRPARTGGGWQHKGRAQRRSIQKWTTCHRAPGVQQCRARAHACRLHARHRRGCRRRRVRRAADRGLAPRVRARPPGQPHLERAGHRLDARARRSRGAGLGLLEGHARRRLGDARPRPQPACSPCAGCSAWSRRPSAPSAWPSRPSTPPGYGGLVERQLARMLAEFGLDRPRHPDRHWVRMMSFSQLAVQRMRQLVPGRAAVYLIERRPCRCASVTASLPKGVGAVGLDMRILRRHPKTVERQHAPRPRGVRLDRRRPGRCPAAVSRPVSTPSSATVPVRFRRSQGHSARLHPTTKNLQGMQRR